MKGKEIRVDEGGAHFENDLIMKRGGTMMDYRQAADNLRESF